MLTIGLISIIIYVPLFSYCITPYLFNRITSIILIYSALLSVNVINISSLASGVGIYNGLFNITSLSLGIESFIFIIGSLIILVFPTIKINPNNKNKSIFSSNISEYSLIILFTSIGQSFLCSSSDLITIFISLELQSFAVYVLCTLYRNSENATSAGIKYFLLGALSSALILLGSAIIYSYTGLTQFEGIYSLCTVISINISNYYTNIQCIILGVILITIGFLFKIGAAPLHNWAPDVYDGTPTIVTSWLTTIPKISILVFILEFQTGLEGSFEALSLIIGDNSINIWKNILLISSFLSLIIGTVVGLSQYRIKRLLAYSTISHVGFILLSLLINNEESIEAFLFYIIQYSITNICAFITLLAFGYTNYNNKSDINNNFTSKNNNKNSGSEGQGDIEFIDELRGQFKINPLLCFSFSMALFSMAGIPPLIGFFGKQMVLYSSTHGGYYFISIICIICSVISASYYLKVIKVLYFDSFIKENDNNNNIIYYKNNNVSNAHSLIISILTIYIILFVFQPQILLNSAHLLALSLFYY